MAGLLELAAALALAASTPEGASPQSVDRLDEVTVEGRLAARARSFIEQVSRPPAGQALARWNTPVCVRVTNMQPAAAQMLIDRIAAVGSVLGVTPGEPDCRPNVLIVTAASEDAAELISRAVDERSSGFRPSRAGTDLGAAALDAFVNSTEPVRWWHVSLPVQTETGETAISLDGEDGAPMIRMPDASRLHSPIRNDLARVIIVVDAERLRGVSFPALANYVTMVALAQMNPRTDFRETDSILSLFSRPDHPGQMTEWDAAFLMALYQSRPNPSTTDQQTRDLARGMAHVLTADPAED
jgi:hypothetical protein